MTRRTAELLTSLFLMIFSIYLMYESAKLPIGWVKGAGPGGGMFPFYMALLILIGSLITTIKTLLAWKQAGDDIQNKNLLPFLNTKAIKLLSVVILLLLATVTITQFFGMYVAIPLLMLVYLRFLGKHGWVLTGTITVLTPVIMFFFFEISLRIILPKGATEKFFQHIYALIG